MTTQAAPVVFLAFANEREDGLSYLRNLPEEARELHCALDTARRAGLCELVVRQGANTDDILDVFQSDEYRNRIAIFHYGGHANGYQLLLDGGERLHGEGFASFLGQQRGIQLVFLNGCATEGHARHLLSVGVSSVIATSQRIDDVVATDFSSRFYQALSGGATLNAAFEEAESAVLSSRGKNPRALYRRGEETSADHYPWVLRVCDGAETINDWSLPEAAGNPLFGLPALPALDLPENPFRHLNWFAREHAWVFFGRGYQIRELYEKVTPCSAPPLVLLYGQSGVGKSSLLDAGLRPRLEATHTVRYAKRDPALGLLGTLRSLLEPEGSFQAAWQNLEADEKPLVVIVDQVEEAFTAPQPVQTDEVTTFFDGLTQIFGIPSARPQGKLILGFRKEWLLEVEQRLRERQLPRTKVALERLDRRGVIEAVEGPTRDERLVRQYGLTVKSGLAEDIATDLLEDPSAPIAPTLQILLTRMWSDAYRKDEAHPDFNNDLYQTLKREGLLLGDFLDRELTALRDWRPELVDSGLALDVLAQHTTSRGTSAQCTATELIVIYRHRAAGLPELVQRCRDRYLLVEPASKGKEIEPATRLAHDTLAPLVRERFEASDLPGQRARRIMESRTRDWVDGKRGTVLDNADLAVVEHGAPGMRAWTEDENRLVTASRAARNHQALRKRTFTILGMLAASFVIIFAGVATWQWHQAERQSRIALSRTLATSAQSIMNYKPQRALLLAVEAVKRPLEADGVLLGEAETVLRNILTVSGGLPLGGHNGPVSSLSFDTEGRWLAIGSEDGTTQLWDLSHPQAKPRMLPVNEGSVTKIAFDPQRRWLASGNRAGATRLWQLDYSYAKPQVLVHGKGVLDLAFDPRGRWIATGGWDRTVRLWDLGDLGTAPRELAGHANSIATLAFDPKGRWLATGGNDSTVLLWDLIHPEAKPRVLLKGYPVGRVAFDPLGRWLVIATNQGTGWLWDLSRPDEEPHALLGHAKGVQDLAFDPKGQWFATSDLNQIRLWKITEIEAEPTALIEAKGVARLAIDSQARWLATGALNGVVQLLDLNHLESVPRVLRGHEDGVTTLAFDPHGRWLATGSRDATARLWDLDQITIEPRVLRRYNVPITVLDFDPLGRWLATGSVDKTARLWDLNDPDMEPTILRDHENGLLTLKFSPQGRWLATGSADKTVRLWTPAEKNAKPLVLSGHDDSVIALAFDERERWLATGSRDGTARLWDLAHTDTEPRILGGHGGPVARLTFDPYERYLVTSGDYDAQGRWLGSKLEEVNTLIWDLRHPTMAPRALRGHKGIPTTIDFDPQGRWLATGGHDRAILWDITDPHTEPRMLHQYVGPVTALAFDSLGRRLAIGSIEGTEGAVKVLDLADLDAKPLILPKHDALLDALAFDPHGRWLATGNRNGIVRLWDIDNLDNGPRVIHGLGGAVLKLAFDSKGRWLATRTADRTVRLWNTDTWTLMQTACQTAGRILSPEEWSQYMGRMNYQTTTCP